MTSASPPEADGGRPLLAVLLSLTIVGVAVAYVALSLGRPEVPSFAPTEAEPTEVGTGLTEPVTYTVDASDPERWVHFDFSRGSVVEDPGPLEWDLAFRRFHVIVNGGAAFPGEGGIRLLEGLALEEVREVPEEGYLPTEAGRDSVNRAIRDWYDYSWVSHVLRPKLVTYAVRTADGRYAKVQILAYYCPGARPGCLTFRYAYQGDGTRSF